MVNLGSVRLNCSKMGICIEKIISLKKLLFLWYRGHQEIYGQN